MKISCAVNTIWRTDEPFEPFCDQDLKNKDEIPPHRAHRDPPGRGLRDRFSAVRGGKLGNRCRMGRGRRRHGRKKSASSCPSDSSVKPSAPWPERAIWRAWQSESRGCRVDSCGAAGLSLSLFVRMRKAGSGLERGYEKMVLAIFAAEAVGLCQCAY